MAGLNSSERQIGEGENFQESWQDGSMYPYVMWSYLPLQFV